MKKLLICAVAALALTACSGNPTDQAIEIVNKATEKVEKAKTAAEVETAMTEMGQEMEKLKEKYPDFEPQGEDKQKLLEASQKLIQASMGKAGLYMNEFAAPAEPAAADEATPAAGESDEN